MRKTRIVEDRSGNLKIKQTFYHGVFEKSDRPMYQNLSCDNCLNGQTTLTVNEKWNEH